MADSRICAGCGIEFVPRHHSQLYHDNDCAELSGKVHDQTNPANIAYLLRRAYRNSYSKKPLFNADYYPLLGYQDPDVFERYTDEIVGADDGTDDVRHMLESREVVWARTPYMSVPVRPGSGWYDWLEVRMSQVDPEDIAEMVRKLSKRGNPMAQRGDARRRARELADSLEKTGVMVQANGTVSPLQTVLEGKHWKVRLENGSYVYSFSTTPSDYRSLKNVEAQLKRMGVRWGEDAQKVKATNGGEEKMPPTSEKKDVDGLTDHQKRAIDIRGRLVTLRTELGATNADLIRIGIDAARTRGIWAYASVESGGVQIGRFLSGKTYGEERTLDFFQAILDEMGKQTVETPAEAATAEPEESAIPEEVMNAMRAKISELQQELAESKDALEKERTVSTSYEEASVAVAQEERRKMDAMAAELEQAQRTQDDAEKARDRLQKEMNLLIKERDSLAADVDALTDALEQAQRTVTAAPTTGPLYIRALQRLVATSTTDEEIGEAFEMAKQIARSERG